MYASVCMPYKEVVVLENAFSPSRYFAKKIISFNKIHAMLVLLLLFRCNYFANCVHTAVFIKIVVQVGSNYKTNNEVTFKSIS